MRRPQSRLRVPHGVFEIDGEPRVLLVGDYPYYRDDAARWEARLDAQAEAGLDVLSCYVPWRHHAPREAPPDFTGRTKPTRDLLRLVELARERDLKMILKPGPFVHAELSYGGLPDRVEPGPASGIEPELDAQGEPLVWPTVSHAERPRPLPAPFDETYLRHVAGWLGALAREVVVGRTWPEGPIVALQLMNEGIYSDSSRAGPLQLGYSRSSMGRYHAFLEDRGRDRVDPPRKIRLLERPTDILPYLDWSAFHGVLYSEAAAAYAKCLWHAGLDREFPIVFNFNPNIETYRTRPASNDGWYTRVDLGTSDFVFGTTNWVGVVAGDAQAFRQYVMMMTAFRGPCMEQNWGFASQYYAPYEYVTPSHFESMLGLACGATGIAAYPVASTRAWRDDADLGDSLTQARTNDREDETSGDYPGNAAILSNGERTAKYWTLSQMAAYLRSEGPRFVRYGPHAPIAWATYGPYAWSGQWLPRGDPDDVLWRPPLQAVPRAAYHGLDAFVEMMTRAGRGFRQVELTRETVELQRTRILCMSGHEYMDHAAQERLAAWVEKGGRLLFTNFVPNRDERMREAPGPLARRLFPHRVLERIRVSTPEPLELEGALAGHALEFAFVVQPPDDARTILRLRGRCVGYVRTVGEGRVLFAGVGPWRAVHSGDDAKLARENQDLTWRLLRRLGADDLPLAHPVDAASGEVIAWQHGEPGRDEQHVFVVARETEGDIRVRVARPGGVWQDVVLRSPSQSVHAFSLAEGRLRACYLKGVNDVRGERVAPSIATEKQAWRAGDSCDLCIVPEPTGGHLASVAHLPPGVEATRLEGVRAPVMVRRIESAGFTRLALR